MESRTQSRSFSSVVFGGSGFIGTHLIEDALLKLPGDVLVADIEPPRVNSDRVKYLYCDVREPIAFPYDFAPTARVYNLAAVHRTPGHEPHEYYETNVSGAINIVEWATRTDVKQIAFTSSIAVYGSAGAPTSEQALPRPNGDYGRSKLLAERILTIWARRDPARLALIVRPAVIFGAGEHGNFSRLAHALARHTFAYPGKNDTAKPCGFVSDLVAAIAHMENRQKPGVTVFNFSYPNHYTISDICHAFNRVAGYKLPHTIPRWLVAMLLAVLRAVNPRDRGTFSAQRVRKLIHSAFIEPEALIEAGFTWPTTLDDALARWKAETDSAFT